MFKIAIDAGHYLGTSGKRVLESLDPKETPPTTLYRVQAGAFSTRTKAEAQVAALKKAGFDAIIKEGTSENESVL